ncbi:MAG: tetratricopeptide repeat protein [Lysobacterales bacterium]
MNKISLRDLWSQLKERKVVRVALVYLIVGLVIMLIGIVAFERLGVPAFVLPLLLVLIFLGFPVALVLAWVFEITPHGIRKDSAGDIESIKKIEDYPDNIPSIAVLPFEDLSENGDQAYFCEGLAEEILDTLRKVPDLRVASRVAAFQIDVKQTGFEEVGRKLHVQTELKGACRKSGEKIHISVQLINTADGTQRWSRQFDRPYKDIFEVQEEIESSVLKILDVAKPHQLFAPRQLVDPKAYDLFLHGLSCFARHTTQDNVYARQLFLQAIDFEPDYGRAWAALAYTYGYSYMYFNATDVNLAEAKRTSKQALKLAPDLAESHVSYGIACCMDQNYKKAEDEFEKAIELDGKNFRAWYFYGRAKVQEGDLERALKLFERASQVRPEDFQSVLLQAQLYTSLGQKGKAIEVTLEGIERVRAMLELNPNDNRALNMGAFALLRMGKTQEAGKWMLTSLKNAPMDSIIQYNGACFFSLAGEVIQALDCLEHCLIKVGNINREWLEHDSDMDNIRHHPRFNEIIKSFPE